MKRKMHFWEGFQFVLLGAMPVGGVIIGFLMGQVTTQAIAVYATGVLALGAPLLIYGVIRMFTFKESD